MRNSTSATLMALGILVASCVSNGSIDSGRRYGIEVGMPSEEASAILRQRGLQRLDNAGVSVYGAFMCGGRASKAGETMEAFARELGPPTICLFTASGRVVAIAWETF